MPEEIISAAGFVPYKILGDVHVSSEIVDRYLPNFFCPAAKSWLAEALDRSGEWAGIVFAQGCNTSNRHFDVWKEHVDTPFLYWFNNPVKDDEAAVNFYKAEMKKIIAELERKFSLKITEENLRSAIEESNALKKQMQRLSALRSDRDIPNRDYLEAARACVQLPKGEALLKLNETYKDWVSRGEFPRDKKRFLLTGSDVTYGEWMDTLDQCDIRIVRDDLSIGERYFARLIPERDDPVDALIEYYLNIPKPATKPTIQKRIDFLLSSLEETKVDAVFSQNVKFCEPYAYDAVIVNNTLKERGHNLIHLEREFSPVTDQQLVNRITAFTEMIEG
jgi:benzoyl-CoA reductase/2-hydroxyglutaryl-CoA dehydratase subunit BcrC/BadD/HgdB